MQPTFIAGEAIGRGELVPFGSWYLTGFLVPYEAPTEQRSDDDGDDSLDQMDRVVEGGQESATRTTRGNR